MTEVVITLIQKAYVTPGLFEYLFCNNEDEQMQLLREL